jgi:hypothetical protein
MSDDLGPNHYFVRATGEQGGFEQLSFPAANAKAAELRMSGCKDVARSDFQTTSGAAPLPPMTGREARFTAGYTRLAVERLAHPH